LAPFNIQNNHKKTDTQTRAEASLVYSGLLYWSITAACSHNLPYSIYNTCLVLGPNTKSHYTIQHNV